MAHADYNCCAICDCKMEYSNDASTKKTICTDCLKSLRSSEINALDTNEFIEWAKSVNKTELIKKLKAIGYEKCFYPNEFDEEINKLTV